MAQSADNVRVGFEGAIYVATGATPAAPTNTDALATGWTEVGYLDDSGLTVAHSDEVSDIKAWQRADIVRKVVTSSDVTFQFNMLETNKQSVELFYGVATESGGAALNEKGMVIKRQPFVLDVIDGDQIHRMYLPAAEVTERGDQEITSENAIKYTVTLTAYPDSNGVKVQHFWSDPIPAVASVSGFKAPSSGGSSS